MSAGTGSQRPEQGSPESKGVPDPSVTVVPSGSPDVLEAQIQARREHLASTIDELTARAAPKAIAQRSLAGLQAKIRNATHTPDGQLRTERLAAAGAAVLVLGAALVWIRRRP